MHSETHIPRSMVYAYRQFRVTCSIWRWQQHIPLQCWYASTTLHVIRFQKIIVL